MTSMASYPVGLCRPRDRCFPVEVDRTAAACSRYFAASDETGSTDLTSVGSGNSGLRSTPCSWPVDAASLEKPYVRYPKAQSPALGPGFAEHATDYASGIKNLSRFFASRIQAGARPWPDHVAPVLGSWYFGGNADFFVVVARLR